MSEHMLRKGAAWWRHEIIMHKMFLDKLNTLFFLLPVLFLFSLNVIVYVFLTVWTLESWELVFLLYWNKSSLMCLLVKRNQIRGKNRLPPGHRSGSTTSLFICRRGEAESAFLKCSRSEDAYAIEAAEARKSRRSSLRSTPTRRLIDRIELVLKICVTQACCHAHVRMQQAQWVKLV